MKPLKKFLTVGMSSIILLALAACNSQDRENSIKKGCHESLTNQKIEKGFDVSQMDLLVSPSDDFYKYAVGTWIEKNKIPPEYSSWGSFNILRKRTDEQLKKILTEIVKNENIKSGTVEQQVRDFYISGLDISSINRSGIIPIKNDLKRIDQIKTKTGIIDEVAYLQKRSCTPMFNLGAEQDLKDSSMMILGLMQGGIGLPYKEYYLSDKPHAKKLRKNYEIFIKKEFKLIGYNEQNAIGASKVVMEIETELAKASRNPVQLRDPIKNYNPMNLDELKKLTPDFSWGHFLMDIGLQKVQKINVGQPEFFKKLNDMMNTVSIGEWKIYLKWTFLRSVSSYLPESFVKAEFDFYGKALTGVKKIKPRWKRILAVENAFIGEALGQLYVKEYFPPENKEKALCIVKNLLKSMNERIKNLSWMTDTTKSKALEKLSVFRAKIGYPDKWINYSKLEIGTHSYVGNYFNAYVFNFERDIKKIGKPTDRSEWYMTPQTVNAYYSPCNNEVVFPAAILQPPFFNINADDAINYGSMGVVIGHEITHGFDDNGAKFNKDGNLEQWWTKKDKQQFEKRTAKLVKQFDQYEPVKGYHVNGKLTLGENIADLGGVTVSYNAFKMTQEYKDDKKIDGFTPSQRFFLGLAQVWKSKIRTQAQILLLNDEHSPNQYRVNGPLSNFTPFIEAYYIKPGSPMSKPLKDRIVIW
jgi:putative endopeptidase